MVIPLEVVRKTTAHRTLVSPDKPVRAKAFLLLEPPPSSAQGNPGDYRLVFESGQELIVPAEVFLLDYQLVGY